MLEGDRSSSFPWAVNQPVTGEWRGKGKHYLDQIDSGWVGLKRECTSTSSELKTSLMKFVSGEWTLHVLSKMLPLIILFKSKMCIIRSSQLFCYNEKTFENQGNFSQNLSEEPNPF